MGHRNLAGEAVTHLWPSIRMRSLLLRLCDVWRALISLIVLLLEDVS